MSEAYGLIERFSEDIDLSMSRKLTESERKRASRSIQSIAERVGLVLLNTDDIFSRYSYNKYVFTCDSLFRGSPVEIIVENNFYLPVYPARRHTIHSFVGQFCDQRGISIPIPFEAAATVMDVQSMERTFIDKVFAICDYRLQGLHDRVSRHLYDIAKLLPEINFTPELTELVKEVREDRMQSKNNPSAQPEYDIPSMLNEIISSGYYKADYVNVTQKLLYEEMSYVLCQPFPIPEPVIKIRQWASNSPFGYTYKVSIRVFAYDDVHLAALAGNISLDHPTPVLQTIYTAFPDPVLAVFCLRIPAYKFPHYCPPPIHQKEVPGLPLPYN